MLYDLKSPDFNRTFKIWCKSYKDKPSNVAELVQGVESGRICSQSGRDINLEFSKGRDDLEDCELLDDYRTQKPGRININWPKIEDLK